MGDKENKQIPEPVRIALIVAAEFNAVSGAAELKQSLPILAMKLSQNEHELSEDILRGYAGKGAAYIKQAANDIFQKPSQKQLSYDEIAARLNPKEKPEVNSLLDAARYGDLEWIKNYHSNGGDITAGDNLALRWAAHDGHLAVVRYCHENGGDITAANNHARREAAENGHLAVVKYCHENGDDITADDNSVLRLAAQNGHLAIVKYCYENGGDITAANNYALRLAAKNGHLAVVKYCHENNGDITAKDNAALRMAAENGHLDIVKYCHENGGDITANNNHALRWAAKNGHLAVVKYCHENGGDITEDDNFALRWAAENGHLDIVKYCHENGGDITAQDNYALWWAAYNGHLEVMIYLIDNGATLSTLSEGLQKQYEENLPRLELWQKLLHSDPPSGLIYYGAKPEYFHHDAFKSAVQWLDKEGYKGNAVNQYAYNLSALFISEDRILRYLDKWGMEGKKTPLHDLAQAIKIPREGKLDLKAWGDASLKFGPEMAKFVKFADRLEKPEASLNKTREVIAEFSYKRGSENPQLAAVCFGYSVDYDDFETALDFYQEHEAKGFKQKKIPDLNIDGAEFGKEGAKLYRLHEGDIRGLFLGEATDCCQSIGNVGKDCAKHGFSSENGGFYVVTDAKDKIIAQSCAWLGKNGEMVLDSLETLGTQLSGENWQSLLKAMKKELKTNHPEINGLYVGAGGATPRGMNLKKAGTLVQPKF